MVKGFRPFAELEARSSIFGFDFHKSSFAGQQEDTRLFLAQKEILWESNNFSTGAEMLK
ncbi:MAG: hypothetical protein ACLFRP_07560 [Puniceicoccaceae bacterium]